MIYYNSCNKWPAEEQRHVHEISGSVKSAQRDDCQHNHRFSTVSGQAVPTVNGDHIHEVMFRTDFHGGHYHEFWGKTLGAVRVGQSHVHYLENATTENLRHRHEFTAATLIEEPIGGL